MERREELEKWFRDILNDYGIKDFSKRYELIETYIDITDEEVVEILSSIDDEISEIIVKMSAIEQAAIYGAEALIEQLAFSAILKVFTDEVPCKLKYDFASNEMEHFMAISELHFSFSEEVRETIELYELKEDVVTMYLVSGDILSLKIDLLMESPLMIAAVANDAVA